MDRRRHDRAPASHHRGIRRRRCQRSGRHARGRRSPQPHRRPQGEPRAADDSVPDRAGPQRRPHDRCHRLSLRRPRLHDRLRRRDRHRCCAPGAPRARRPPDPRQGDLSPRRRRPEGDRGGSPRRRRGVAEARRHGDPCRARLGGEGGQPRRQPVLAPRPPGRSPRSRHAAAWANAFAAGSSRPARDSRRCPRPPPPTPCPHGQSRPPRQLAHARGDDADV